LIYVLPAISIDADADAIIIYSFRLFSDADIFRFSANIFFHADADAFAADAALMFSLFATRVMRSRGGGHTQCAR